MIIGCGHMGNAILQAWYLKTKNSYIVIDPLNYKKIQYQYKRRVKAYQTLKEIKSFKNIDIVIFAIKPQVAKKVLENFREYRFNKNTIFVSIVAGKRIKFFQNYIGNSKFVRVMPNMPSKVNSGMSCLVKNYMVSKSNKKIIDSLFLKIGETLWLDKELDINKVTAISGSGPGYIYFFIDAFEKAALQLGLGKLITRKLVYQTFFGSAKLLLDEKKIAEVLASNIAIKGGTTEAGLKIFKKNKNLHKILIKVVKAAYSKSNQLGK